MQIGFDVGATKIESVVLKDSGEENSFSTSAVFDLSGGRATY